MRLAGIGLLVVFSVGPLRAATDSAKPVVECGATLTRSAKLEADLVCGASALTIATPGVALNCAGHTIRGIPGGVAVQVTATNVSVNDCTIEGFTSGMKARDASGLTVARNRFSNLNSAVSVDASDHVFVKDNRFESSLGNLSIRDCPRAVVERNEFVPLARHLAGITLERSPGARIKGNRSTQGLGIAVWRASDDSEVANNSLGEIGRVSVAFSSRVDVRHNSAGVFDASHDRNLFGVELMGAMDCEVAHNQFTGVGVLLYPWLASGSDGSSIIAGADGNRIRENEIVGAVYGILLFGGSHNLIDRNECSRCEIGVAAFPYIISDILPAVPSTDNDLRRNVFDTGLVGIYAANAGGNRYEQNLLRGFGIGFAAIATVPAVPPDVIRNNIITDNGFFGLLVEGTSPSVSGNAFERNGWADQPPGPEMYPLNELILSARGGIGLFPFNGIDPTAFDDGDPTNDLLAEPAIGLPDEPNVFENNAFADIYALDTRASNASELLTSNQFQDAGSSVRVRQDWFGAIRVVLHDGGAATGAAVELLDALDTPVAAMTTGSNGVSPNGCDPTRPMGKLSLEEGIPTPQWLRITEYIVDRNGDRTDLTPHHISVQSDGLSGDATYDWNGCGTPQCESLRRYQIADVTLGP